MSTYALFHVALMNGFLALGILLVAALVVIILAVAAGATVRWHCKRAAHKAARRRLAELPASRGYLPARQERPNPFTRHRRTP